MKLPSSSDFDQSVVNALLPVDDVARLIASGAVLALAGTDAALSRLPRGEWIGGTTPYFMTAEGGVVVGDDQVFVTDLSALGAVVVTSYGESELERISSEAPDQGFALAIIPAESECHANFALDAPFYPDTFLKPTVGWIAGYNLAKGGPAKVYDGTGPHAFTNRAVVAHVRWDDDALAVPSIVNAFRPGKGDVLTFAEQGFTQTTCQIGGKTVDFAAYLKEKGLEGGALPLVGDYGGAPINVSLQRIDTATGEVHLYAPVFTGVEYRFAEPLEDYAKTLADGIAASNHEGAFWSCNCILNFLFGGLEGKAIGGLAGPVTFGEIAYQLVNQTLVSLRKL